MLHVSFLFYLAFLFFLLFDKLLCVLILYTPFPLLPHIQSTDTYICRTRSTATHTHNWESECEWSIVLLRVNVNVGEYWFLLLKCVVLSGGRKCRRRDHSDNTHIHARTHSTLNLCLFEVPMIHLDSWKCTCEKQSSCYNANTLIYMLYVCTIRWTFFSCLYYY